jgi:hypothetical protein
MTSLGDVGIALSATLDKIDKSIARQHYAAGPASEEDDALAGRRQVASY